MSIIWASRMEKIFIICLIITFGNVLMASAWVFQQCELAHELMSLTFPQNQLPDWVCLIENESARNTSALGGPNSNGSYDYGIFQINEKYWCGEGKECGITCSALIDEEITDDGNCALKIHRRHGFSAWRGWTKRCKNATRPNLDNCFSTSNNGDDHTP